MSEDVLDLEAVWIRAIAELDDETLPAQHRAWMRLTRPLALVQDTAVLATPNDFAREVLDTQLRDVIVDALSRQLGRDVRVAVTVEPETAVDVEPEAEREPVAPPNPTPISRGASEPARLNPKYQFETFVIGSSNRFAHAAAVAVAEAPAKAYNPLFIYGDSGLGKTHLLHAIGHYAMSLFAGVRVRYVSSEEFTNDFINSIANNRGSAFQARYRDVDILLIDDIQFLQGRAETQEAFFHTFNTLHDHDKQVVITSDVPPKHLTGFEDRMRSRFEWGLITDVQAPDLETRIAILRKKAQSERLHIPDEVLEYIATVVSSNIRELEG